MAITHSTAIDVIEAEIHALGDYWEQIGQWQQPSAEQSIKFMIIEAAEALDELMRLDGGFVRNNPRLSNWDKVDEEVADTLIMGLRYFATRGLSAEQSIRDKIERMHTKKEFAAQQAQQVEK